MDLGSAIIGAILIAICIVPLFLISQNRKGREKKSLQSLISIANQQNCTISNSEICGDFVIGIDENKKFVFYFKQLNDKIIERCINLAEIQKCAVKNTFRTVAGKKGNQNVIDKLELSFIPFDKNKNEIKLEFFNSNINSQLVGELQICEKWSKLISVYLKNQKDMQQSPVKSYGVVLAN